MLTRMKLENFKAWQEADLTFGKVTAFFGANSAGKSSLFHLLLLLKQTRNATDRAVVLDFGGRAELVNLGTFADVVHLHDEAKMIRWLLEWTLPKALKIPDPRTPSATPLFAGNSLQTRYEVGFGNTSLLPRELAYRFNDVDFLLRLKTIKKRQFELVADPPPFTFIRKQGRAWPLPQPVKTHLFPSQARAIIRMRISLGISSWHMRTSWIPSTISVPCVSIRSENITGPDQARRMWATAVNVRWTRCSPPPFAERREALGTEGGGKRSSK